LFFKQ
jgi:signal recognition particle subunit SRP54